MAREKIKTTRIVVVDDHPMMREGLAQLISKQQDLTIVAEACDAQTAISEVERTKPDLVLLDITLPGRSGIEVIKDLRAILPNLHILVISMHDESVYAERALRAGARGYIMKQEGGKKILEAMRQVINGAIHVSPAISARILEIFSGAANQGGKSAVEQLTDRELEVFEMIGNGLEVKEIADKLNLSVKTVEVHRTNIKEKLRAKSIGEVIRMAVRYVDAQAQG